MLDMFLVMDVCYVCGMTERERERERETESETQREREMGRSGWGGGGRVLQHSISPRHATGNLPNS